MSEIDKVRQLLRRKLVGGNMPAIWHAVCDELAEEIAPIIRQARAAERERCAAWVKANRHGHSINELAAAIRALPDSDENS